MSSHPVPALEAWAHRDVPQLLPPSAAPSPSSPRAPLGDLGLRQIWVCSALRTLTPFDTRLPRPKGVLGGLEARSSQAGAGPRGLGEPATEAGKAEPSGGEGAAAQTGRRGAGRARPEWAAREGVPGRGGSRRRGAGGRFREGAVREPERGPPGRTLPAVRRGGGARRAGSPGAPPRQVRPRGGEDGRGPGGRGPGSPRGRGARTPLRSSAGLGVRRMPPRRARPFRLRPGTHPTHSAGRRPNFPQTEKIAS